MGFGVAYKSVPRDLMLYFAPILKLVEEMRDSETSVVVVVDSNRTYPLFTFGNKFVDTVACIKSSIIIGSLNRQEL